jgi:dolichyl-phosphate-mannose-protein mannosyltransferase
MESGSPGRSRNDNTPAASPSFSRDRAPRRAKALLLLSLVLPLSLYFAFATRFIQAHVGYEMDEALYVESAVFLLRGSGEPPFTHDSGSWFTAFGRSWPLMIIPYVGAAKGYVTLPLFAIFGISAEVARFSAVLLGALGIAGLLFLLGREISRAAALIVGVLLGIHPSYLDFTVFDNGGVSVWMAAMGLGAWALAIHLRRQSTPSAVLLGLALGLGVWTRANVLWLISAALVAALVTFGRRAIPPLRHVAAMAIGGFCGVLPFLVYEYASRLATFRFISSTRQSVSLEKILSRLRALAELMISDSEQRGIWAGPQMPSWQVGIGAVLLAAVPMCLFVRFRSSDPTLSRWRRAFAISAIVLTMIMLASRLGIAHHHLVAVLPLALTALTIFGLEVARRFRAAIAPLAAAAAVLVLLLGSWDVRIDRGLRQTRGKWFWSSAIDDVRDYVQSKRVTPDRLKILSWGFQNNFYVGSGGSVYGSELFWGATPEHSSRARTWESEIRDGGSFLLYLFPTGPPELDAAANGFSKALEKYPGPRQERRFLDRSGSPVALLVEIPPTQ